MRSWVGVSCGAPGDVDLVAIALSVSTSPICASSSFPQSGVFENPARTRQAPPEPCCAVAADIVGTPIPAFMRVSGAKRSSQAENAGSIPVIRSGSRLTDHQMPRETVPVSGLLYRTHSVRDGQSNNGVNYFRKVVNDSTESLLAINAFSGASSSAYPSDSPHASNSPSAIGNSLRITR